MRRLICAIVALSAVVPAAAPGQAMSPNAQPGAYFHAQANQNYQAGRYYRAIHQFRLSASWGDKLSQFNVGVMHYQGEGVGQDAARAWAWFELAAERGYPQFVDTADQVLSELSGPARQRARRIYESELLPRYGDEITVPRAARRMERERRLGAGSRLGARSGPLLVRFPSGAEAGGEYFYTPENWDFRRMIEAETELFEALGRTRIILHQTEMLKEDGNE